MHARSSGRRTGIAALVLGFVELLVAPLVGCAPAPPVATAPPPLPPVQCSEAPAGNMVTITCRYFAEWQMAEVWERSTQRAAVVAVSLGFTHVQWLALDRRPEVMRSATTPVECNRTSYFTSSVECSGGQPVYTTVSTFASSQFLFLAADDARARANDPLIPQERRPFSARERAGAGAAVTAPGAPPKSQSVPVAPAAGWRPE